MTKTEQINKVIADTLNESGLNFTNLLTGAPDDGDGKVEIMWCIDWIAEPGKEHEDVDQAVAHEASHWCMAAVKKAFGLELEIGTNQCGIELYFCG